MLKIFIINDAGTNGYLKNINLIISISFYHTQK